MNNRKTYSIPMLTVHGSIEVITQNCGLRFSDSPSGCNDYHSGSSRGSSRGGRGHGHGHGHDDKSPCS